MIRKLKRYFKSRKIVLALMLLLSFSILLSFIIPQQAITPGEQFFKWQEAHQVWLPLTELLGLHRLFTAPWFVALLFLFLIALVITTYEQFRLAYKKTFAEEGGIHLLPSSVEEIDHGHIPPHLEQTKQTLIENLRKEGYFRIAGNNDDLRFVKHPWGYWGNFLLHLGILTVVAASITIAATEKRGVLRLLEGQTHHPNTSWLYEEHGLFVSPLRFDESIQLVKVSPEFLPDGGTTNLSSEVLFISSAGHLSSRTVAIDSILNYKGLRVYQKNNFGKAFKVVLTDETGRGGVMVLDMQAPLDPAVASYGSFDFTDLPQHIEAKYYADVSKKTLASNNPLLFLLMLDKNEVLGELTLKKGESGRLGPYEAKLVEVKRWTEFMFLDTIGMPGIFFGFFVIILGASLHYFTIPREFYCRKNEKGFNLVWRGSRFKHLYKDEATEVLLRLSRKKIP